MDCLFCKIVDGSVSAKILYQDELVIAFDDIRPNAPTHKLIIPRRHIASLHEAKAEDTQVLGHLLQTARIMATNLEVAEAGYRVVMNINPNGGQTVYHIHLHLLGGRQMTWPPG